MNLALLLNPQEARKRADSPRARTPINPSAVLLRARTLINLSAVLYEQSAARPGLPAKVSNIDLNFVPSVAFIPNVHIADSLRARTPINLSAVLYEQAAARTSLPAEVSNIDLNFVPSVAFIPNVHMANSLRARTPINPSAVLYEQAAAQTSLPAKVSNISPRARTLINPSAVLYEQADAQSGLPAEVSIMDLDFVPSIAFDAIGNVELTGDLLGNADRVNNNNNNIAPTLQFSPTALLNLRSLASKRPALSSSNLNCGRTNPTIAGQISLVEQLYNSDADLGDDDNVQLVRDNIEELICVGKVKHTYVQAHTVPYPDSKKYLGNSGQQGRIKVSFRRARNNRNNLNIIVTNPTGREFSRVDMKSSTRLAHQHNALVQGPTPREPGSIYVLRSVNKIRANVADVFDTVISKSDEVPTREPSSHIKTELYPHQKQALYFMLRDNSHKFYRLVITGEDTHYKQTIKKAYIMSPERASLILFIT
ncbi:hypothetical protein HBI88_106450 [Parastagonospora nodorum]|nr:hypothetical protein HBI87_237340 [Parastagonospora nodorum]KAH5922552.1 hypothetical protein HBI86_238020 [Parastagonospora nodorum]KAH5928108.1 hypothetical protein HBI88_106450 [Parastagonospora nodorum]KAH5954070.1 hypothetical protein HBI85_216070 [Parastagonospora nodorum]